MIRTWRGDLKMSRYGSSENNVLVPVDSYMVEMAKQDIIRDRGQLVVSEYFNNSTKPEANADTAPSQSHNNSPKSSKK
ncbi:hypothetical protein MCHI_003841 [Candidatus Magnetoovum chiemensis]|nr:hypothetical protein MCHI_003841 [Candidatus Magnetoovum chiemensis]